MAELKSKLSDRSKVRAADYALGPDYSEERYPEKPKIGGYSAQGSIMVETGAGDRDLLGARIQPRSRLAFSFVMVHHHRGPS